MRITHIITRLIVGGAQENTLLSCQGQHERGHEVTLITGPPLGPEGSLLDQAKAAGYKIEVLDSMRRAVNPLRDWGVYAHLTRRLNKLKPDIVHTHSSKAGILGRWAAHRTGVPVVIHTIHGLAFTASTSPMSNGFYKWLERRAAPMSTRIVCVADAMRDQSLAAGIGRADQYVTIYSGIRTEPFLIPPAPRPFVRQQLGFAEDHIVVGTIARLFELKGHDDLLEAAPDLCSRFPSLRFLWVGDGILRESFERRMSATGLRNRFILTGLVPPEKVPELTGAMDILVHPSRREGLARALAQAALAGKPVVAYDVDGNREAMIDQETGFLIPPFDSRQLSAAVAVLIQDAQRRRDMGAAGRRFALGRFDSTIMVQRLEALYRDLLTHS